MRNWSGIVDTLNQQSAQHFEFKHARYVGGGCINETWILEGQQNSKPQSYFVKLNQPEQSQMFAAEAEGLMALAAPGVIAVPQPLTWGIEQNQAYLVMSTFQTGSGSGQAIRQLGRQLAALHRHQQADFGWHRENTIGATQQINTPDSQWIRFFREQRLGFQLSLAARNGYTGKLQSTGERLLACVGDFFSGYQPRPSLLHGDLWSGNYAITQTGVPILFDPAVYYGDREADLAMTELFGGFPVDFYAAYQESWSLDPGYATRKSLYNLYHILNHLNLFGGAYAGQAQRSIEQLLSVCQA
ncbi:fructosamine kinase family protein [Candidatus Venteria ishoeyi]|uniref:Fructosamine kinase n=1 Tax=Candidatus Venteria ishoeyi TaxID=1899563 RepID=A0A1H6FG32_9GAMM|nr:fructosamine kinase family protein [Candidatus Venteria ishoeyi]SEH08299.1 Fructosamine kinase [Candidatus Venteria ishoeyi]